MASLALDTMVRCGADGRLTATLSRDWEIWGPNGGYVSAIALRAAGLLVPDDHRPATYSCQYLSAGPFGPVEVIAEPARQGRNAWCINVALEAGGKRFHQAQVWTTNKADGPDRLDRRMPEVPRPEGLKRYEELVPYEAPHPFWAHFESRPVNFIPWGTVDPRGAVRQSWYRLRDFDAAGDVFLDHARALVLADTLPWPAFHHGLGQEADYIAPTIDLTIWFHQRSGPSDWLFCDVRTDVAGGGLLHGHVDVWTEDGRLVASSGSHLLHVPARR